jgi:hypothetical protein
VTDATGRLISGSAGYNGYGGRNVALVDLLDRLLAGGVVIAGEVTLGIADVDLVRISLRALVATIRAAEPGGWDRDWNDRDWNDREGDA